MTRFEKNHLTVFQSALFKTNAAVIRSKDAVILTDPTWLPDEIDEIRHFIDDI
ncbi:MAG: hypothetical protein U5K84_06230 [Alkalibacterium sp.]|nr:hypothetical protein [Alkalibacterium sp.]